MAPAVVPQVRERALDLTKLLLTREAALERLRHTYVRPEIDMHSPTRLNELHQEIQDNTLIPPLRTGLNVGIDWRETCWFLKHEEDELAGYLFAEDCEMREGSD